MLTIIFCCRSCCQGVSERAEEGPRNDVELPERRRERSAVMKGRRDKRYFVLRPVLVSKSLTLGGREIEKPRFSFFILFFSKCLIRAELETSACISI